MVAAGQPRRQFTRDSRSVETQERGAYRIPFYTVIRLTFLLVQDVVDRMVYEETAKAHNRLPDDANAG